MGNILLLVGTNRPGANALRVGKVIKSFYDAAGQDVDVYSLHQMPRELFDPQCYATKPDNWLPVQQMVVESRGIHLVTPEYNGGFPGVLKYFIDMLKFPESFVHKPVAFVGEAAGVWGAIRPVEQLQQIFSYRNAYVFPERVLIPKINERFDASGRFVDQEILERLKSQVEGFVKFCETFRE